MKHLFLLFSWLLPSLALADSIAVDSTIVNDKTTVSNDSVAYMISFMSTQQDIKSEINILMYVMATFVVLIAIYIFLKYHIYKKKAKNETKGTKLSTDVLKDWKNFISKVPNQIIEIETIINDAKSKDNVLLTQKQEIDTAKEGINQACELCDKIFLLPHEIDKKSDNSSVNSRSNHLKKVISKEGYQNDNVNDLLKNLHTKLNNAENAITSLKKEHFNELNVAKSQAQKYFETVIFLSEEEKQADKIKEYAGLALNITNKTRTAYLALLSDLIKSEDMNLKNVVYEYIAEFINKAETTNYNDWVSELTFVHKTGLFLSNAKYNGNSKLSGILSGVKEQYDNFKFRLFKDFFGNYVDAMLILYQKLIYINKMLPTSDVKIVKMYFSQKDYVEILNLVKNLEYHITEVTLYDKDPDSNDIEIEKKCENVNFENNIVLDILHIGVNYGNSNKNKTIIIKNEISL